jgi:L-fucono-1,5-lactonase
MIVDAHQHFWSSPLDRYPWMTDGLAAIRRPFGPRDLAPLLEANHVDRTVVVQARMDLQETHELLALAAANDFVAGVVGWVDLTDPGVGATLGALRSGPNGSKLVGIRHQVHDEGDPNWLLRPDVQRGIAAVGEADLTYDFLVRPRELPAARETARRFPRMRFVLDHLAKPPIRSGDLDAWKQGIATMARLWNVSRKLSGLVTEADWTHWTEEQLVPVIT